MLYRQKAVEICRHLRLTASLDTLVLAKTMIYDRQWNQVCSPAKKRGVITQACAVRIIRIG